VKFTLAYAAFSAAIFFGAVATQAAPASGVNPGAEAVASEVTKVRVCKSVRRRVCVGGGPDRRCRVTVKRTCY
jgi:hypothetical protein